jgi:single-stranded-DNA-specific exonuclease
MINQKAKTWHIAQSSPRKKAIAKYGPVLASLLFNRGITKESDIEKFLSPDFSEIVSPQLMPGIEESIALIDKAISEGEKICIYGDYDVDGITSTALLISFFKKIKADCIYYLPSREKEGYGLSVEAIDKLVKRGVNLLITVDCGITAIAEVNYAKQKGIEVIITDHHEVPENLPSTTIIHPNLLKSKYPYNNLAGVGVAFKLVQALAYKYLQKPEEFIKWSLDLVALGTIADVVPLIGENRIFTHYGLIILSKTKRIGLNNLISSASLKKNELDSFRVAFYLCPRLNATGRISDASKGLDLVLAEDEVVAKELTDEITTLNTKRQKITENIMSEALTSLALIDDNRRFILLSSKNWPSGVIGIVASKLVDKTHRPVILFEEKDGLLHGSARSIDQIDIIHLLEQCTSYLVRYGGHKMAAGLVIKKDDFDNFYLKLEELVSLFDQSVFCPRIKIDMSLSLDQINLDLFSEVNRLMPFGCGNPEPIFFTSDCIVRAKKFLGNDHHHVKWTVQDQKNNSIDALGFGMGGLEINLGDKVDLVFKLHINEWGGKKKVELKVVDICKKN